MSTLGYGAGQPFGDPARFTRGTGEAEIDHFNQWMRSQPWHQQFIRATGQDPHHINLSEKQQKQLAAIARANGVPMPKDFSPDAAGNLNQNSRTNRNIALGLAIGGAAFGGAAALGAFGGAGAAGGGAAAGTAAGTGGTLASTTIGSGFIPAIAGGTGVSTAGMLASGLAPASLGALTAGGSGVDAVRRSLQRVSGGNGTPGRTDWLSTLAPLLGLGVSGAMTRGNGGPSGIPAGLQGQISDLLSLQTDKAKRTTPVHEAAMRLALQLAPTGNDSPRLRSAIDATVARPETGTDPQVLEAISRLMGR